MIYLHNLKNQPFSPTKKHSKSDTSISLFFFAFTNQKVKTFRFSNIPPRPDVGHTIYREY
jgi:hypothetical protein